MIILREMDRSKEKEIALAILNENNIVSKDVENELIYIIADNNCIFGLCKVGEKENYGVLEYIVISRYKRGFNYGEGLLRATFNKMVSEKIDKIYFKKEDSYLLKKGFTKIDRNEIYDDYNLVCNLNNLFSQKCSGVGAIEL